MIARDKATSKCSAGKSGSRNRRRTVCLRESRRALSGCSTGRRSGAGRHPPAALAQVFLDDPEIADVGLERDVEDVAEIRYGADQAVDHDIADLALHLVGRHPEAIGLVDNIGRERHRERVADAGRKPADAVPPGRRVAASSTSRACAGA